MGQTSGPSLSPEHPHNLGWGREKGRVVFQDSRAILSFSVSPITSNSHVYCGDGTRMLLLRTDNT